MQIQIHLESDVYIVLSSLHRDSKTQRPDALFFFFLKKKIRCFFYAFIFFFSVFQTPPPPLGWVAQEIIVPFPKLFFLSMAIHLFMIHS